MFKVNLKKERGISLLEVMLSLAIIGIILVMATRYFGLATGGSSANTAVQQIGELKQGYIRYLQDTGTNAASKAALATAGYITTQTANAGNPWGGTYTADTAGDTLTVDKIPEQICQKLSNQLTGGTAACTGTTLAVPLLN